jgi:putative intracellular protease/amidase
MKRTLSTLILVVLAASAGANERKPYTRNVAIVVYEDAEPLDWAGPFEVYNDAGGAGRANGEAAFNVYIVSKTTDPLNAQGLQVVPNYSIATAPRPDIVVFPGGPSGKIYNDPAFFAWAKKAADEAEIAQSVCTGAFVLGKAGLLDGLEATTHHSSIDALGQTYPKVRVENGRRFVDNGHVVTTAGISAGIDGSLHVVARLLGRRIADDVATYMEYHWTPEPFLATGYAYLNPSTDARGRLMQTGEMELDAKSFADAEKTFRGVLKDDPGNRSAWSNLGVALDGLKDHAGAARALARAVEGSAARNAPYVYYRAAVQYALAGLDGDAVDALRRAFAAGFPDRDIVDHDPDLARLRDDPRLEKVAASK